MLNTASLTPINRSQEHVAIVQTMLQALTDHMRCDLMECDEPKAQALLATAAEVLEGLHTAFDHYRHGNEAALGE